MRISRYSIKPVDDKVIIDQTHILEHNKRILQNSFQNRKQETTVEMEKIFSDINMPKL